MRSVVFNALHFVPPSVRVSLPQKTLISERILLLIFIYVTLAEAANHSETEDVNVSATCTRSDVSEAAASLQKSIFTKDQRREEKKIKKKMEGVSACDLRPQNYFFFSLRETKRLKLSSKHQSVSMIQ